MGNITHNLQTIMHVKNVSTMMFIQWGSYCWSLHFYVFHHVFLQFLFLQSWKSAQRGILKRLKKKKCQVV